MNIFLFIILGSCTGSFLCLVAERLQKNKNFLFSRSRCNCGKPIPWYLNIPILSYLFLNGKTKCCNKKIPKHYLILEIVTGLIFGAIRYKYELPTALCLCLFMSFLIVMSLIDLDTMTIPNILSITCAVCGIILSSIMPDMHHTYTWLGGLFASLVGLCISSGILFWVGGVSEMFLKKEALGIGDIKLVGAIGTFIGTLGAIKSIIYGSVIGLSVIFLMFLLKNFKMSRKMRIPFAPILSCGALVYVLYL